MGVFIRKIGLFFGILYFGIFTLVLITNGVIRAKADFTLKPNINKIVIGNSHPAGTFNDSLISNFKNLADPGDSYFYGYQKLKEILKSNPQINTVYVEINPKTILRWEDSKIWKKNQIPNYLPFLNLEDHLVLVAIDAWSYQQELIRGVSKNTERIIYSEYNLIDSVGGFRHVTASRLDSILKKHAFDPTIQHPLENDMLSEHDIKYLNKLVEYCNQNDLQIIFVRSPYHKKFDARNFEDIFQDFRERHYKNVPFQDFKDLPFEDWEFKDLEHLNNLGARRFSLWFEQLQ